MKVGVYFDLRNVPGSRWDWSRLYGFTLEMCEEAERLGAGSVWFSEHHLFDDGYLPQPLTMAAAAAARTRHVRIGTAVLIAPIRRSAHIAETAAVIDQISGGRLDLGLGTGYRVPEFELFQADDRGRYGRTEDAVRDIRSWWTDGRLLPPPCQDPFPIWLGYLGPKGARRAGELGTGLLSADARLRDPYVAGLRASGYDDASARMAGHIQAFVTEDPEADWPTVARHLAYQVDSYNRHWVEGTDVPPRPPVDPQKLRSRPLGGILGSFLFGTPDQVAAEIKRFCDGAPVDTVFIFASIGGMTEQMVTRHVQTICTKLRPLLQPGTGRVSG